MTCGRCVARVRSTVAETAELFPLLSVELHARVGAGRAGDGMGGDEHPMPFGDLLSLIGPGAAVSCRDGQPDDAPSVVGTLAGWEDDWRSVRGLPGAPSVASVASCAAFLLEQHGWAAQHHPAFDEYAAEVRQLLGRVRSALRLVDTPVTLPAPCFECGERLVRHYDPPQPCRHDGPHRRWCDQGGLRDEAVCTGCRRVYSPAEYLLALRATLEVAAADTSRVA
jgi:hypothetical protein